MTLEIKQLELDLINTINKSNMNIAVVTLILEKILTESQMILQNELIKEQEKASQIEESK